MKQVLCEVGENTYGIDIAKVQGIEKDLEIVPVPNVDELVEGITNLRGQVVPIISLHRKLHVDSNLRGEEMNYIITKIGELFVGFRVDAVAEIVEVPEKDFLPVPLIVSNEDTSYIDSIIQVNKKLVLVLDVEGILNEAERKKITKLVEEA